MCTCGSKAAAHGWENVEQGDAGENSRGLVFMSERSTGVADMCAQQEGQTEPDPGQAGGQVEHRVHK
jgi:hypothetical protein